MSKPNYTQEQLKKLDEKSIEWNGEKYTKYEISQMQRTAERKVRALKRRTLAAQTAVENAPDEETRMVLQTEYMATAAKLKDSEKQLKDFCQKTRQQRDTFREQVAGFGRSEAQKAVHAAKQQQKQAASQTNGSTPTGHTAEVKPPTPKDNGGTGEVYKNEKIPGKVLTFGDDGGIIKTDQRFEIQPPKIKQFLLKPGAKHAQEFFDVGYTSDDYELLFDDIANCYDESKAVDIRKKENGVEDFSIFMDLGVDEKKRFRIVWRKETPDSKPRLITGHRED